jgi:WD40 repeat protein
MRPLTRQMKEKRAKRITAFIYVFAFLGNISICRIWDLKTKTMTHSSSATDVTCMTMDDNYLILGGGNCDIQIVDYNTGICLRRAAPLREEESVSRENRSCRRLAQ